MLLAFILYYHGLSLEVIGRFFGGHKTTGMRWLSPLAQVNWQGAVQQGKRFFSGTMAVDEKWIKIAGVWWYLFVAVDHVSGLPLHVALLPSNAKPYCELFLLQLKALGYHPKVIITDGWDAYVQAIVRVFPHAQHLLCRFHALRAAFRRLRQQLPHGKARRRWADKLKGLFRTPS
jgi:transposase-like protein